MTDFDEMQERHRRRIALMRAMGETNRMETRMHILMALAGMLAAVALVLSIM